MNRLPPKTYRVFGFAAFPVSPPRPVSPSAFAPSRLSGFQS
jgi:hypothetical protein